MNRPAPADVRRWSEQVARDPGSSAFVPLAEAYRRQGNLEAAKRVCLRGLERSPRFIEGHTLLARLYLEDGDRELARDEWSTALRLDVDNFEANRGMGFSHLERGDFGSARRHLEKAANQRPNDLAVREALTVLAERLDSETGEPVEVEDDAATGDGAPIDPASVFDPLLSETPFLGALVLDGNGLVLAGHLSDEDSERAATLGAILSGSIEEADRTARHLSLGAWRGILIDTEWAQVHLEPLQNDLTVLLAARRDAPTGWVVRTASRASELATRFVEKSS